MKFRDIIKMNGPNGGTRTLFESVASNEVLAALKDWKKQKIDCVLIGGLAVSHYVKPRMTMDVDVLFMSKSMIPRQVAGFERHREGAFQHNKTHVEIEVISASTINQTQTLVNKVFTTAIESDGIKIASPSALVALKLGRFSLQDRADIVELYKISDIDLDGFGLDSTTIEKYRQLIEQET